MITIDVNEFISIDRLKNKQIIKFKSQNIYFFLREMGFRKSTVRNKRVYFRRQDCKVIPVRWIDIKHFFIHSLRAGDYANISLDINYMDILNSYHITNPIRNNKLLNECLNDTLTQTEEHEYLLQTDYPYKHKFKIQQMLSKLDEWKFKKTIYPNNSICKNTTLYYKGISGQKYLIFHYFNSYNKHFDCSVATYANEKQIGRKEPIELKTIKFSFDLDEDFQLIQDWIKVCI